MNQVTMVYKNAHPGFTLVEMAVVLVIVGLLLAGLLIPLSAQIDQRNYSDAQKAMNDIKDALAGYAMSHTALDGRPFLPCPDITNDGIEDRLAADCSNVNGDIPWATLSTPATDSWGNRYRYRVTQAFANSNVGFTLTTPGNMTILDASGGNNIATFVPAVIISRGVNNVGAGFDEQENSNLDATFVSHTLSSVAGNEFDDLVTWISPGILLSRMVSAGKLP